jgi:hypothetical protein
MIDEVQTLVDSYVSWLKGRTVLREVADSVEITTPYLDRHNDCLQIYAKRENDAWILTDDGYVIDDLKLSGCSLESKKRQDLLRLTLNGFGVQLKDDALVVHASRDNFPARKHSLIQAMLAVNDLFYLAKPIVASIFLEDVTAWLDLHEVRANRKVRFTGKSGFDHVFDFVIPESHQQPERIIKAIRRPVRDTAEVVAFAWSDIRQVRPEHSRAYALLNDSEHPLPSGVVDALRSYDVRPIPWSGRENIRQELAA